MQKSNRIECRVTDLEKADWQKAAGGSRRVSEWLRGLANAECARLRGEKKMEQRRELYGVELDEPIPNAKPLIVREQIAAEQDASLAPGKEPAARESRAGKCPRAHHHRPGRYCGTCKKVATKVGE